MRHPPGGAAVRAALVLAAAVASVAAASRASAAETKPPPAATISILAIQASTEDKPACDKELAPIQSALAKSGHNTFRLILRDARAVPYGTAWQREMAEGYSLSITAEEATANDVKLALVWTRTEKDKDGNPKVAELQRLPLTIRKGKYFLSGGWKLKKGALLAAVSVQ